MRQEPISENGIFLVRRDNVELVQTGRDWEARLTAVLARKRKGALIDRQYVWSQERGEPELWDRTPVSMCD